MNRPTLPAVIGDTPHASSSHWWHAPRFQQSLVPRPTLATNQNIEPYKKQMNHPTLPAVIGETPTRFQQSLVTKRPTLATNQNIETGKKISKNITKLTLSAYFSSSKSKSIQLVFVGPELSIFTVSLSGVLSQKKEITRHSKHVLFQKTSLHSPQHLLFS